MAKYSPFQFLKNRKICLPLTQEELENFDLYMTQMALSMAEGMLPVLKRINTLSFFKLPKKYQCMSFLSLEGYELVGVWQKTRKKKSMKSKKEIIEKAMKILDRSENEVVSYFKYDLVDVKRINKLYRRIYEAEKIKLKKK